MKSSLLLATLLFTATTFADPLQLFVTPNGNDTWSGSLSAPNAAKSDGPLATIAGARDTLRVLKQRNALADGAVVTIAPGTYRIETAIEFTFEDSGTAAAPIVYRGTPGASWTYSRATSRSDPFAWGS